MEKSLDISSKNLLKKEEKTPLLGKTLSQLKLLASEWGIPAYTASQLVDWIYLKRVDAFEAMTNVSKKNRSLLEDRALVGYKKPIREVISRDGTRKWLFETLQGNFIETVLIPEDSRNTLCVSSQIGCKMGCYFCQTGKQHFQGNLTPTEILNQCLAIEPWNSISNIVFMGMGEPLDNIDAVLQAITCLTHPKMLALSPKRITVSTVGVEKGLKRFLEETECHLAVSLHNPIPEERASIMPAERAMPLRELLQLLENYDFSHQRRLTFEYIVFTGFNDSPAHIQAITRIARRIPCRINLIRFHRIPNVDLPPTQDKALEEFFNRLEANGLKVTIRQSRGEDIDAACGMLSTKEEMDRKERARQNEKKQPGFPEKQAGF